MGMILGRKAVKQNTKMETKIEEVDIVKSKLKIGRQKISNFVKSKKQDVQQINGQIKEKLPEFEEKKNKKLLIPLLQTKKDLQTLIKNGEVRIKLLNDKLGQVEMNQLNMETVNALEDSNKYINSVQKELEQKDWRVILEQSKHKYELEWPEEDIEDDETFNALWTQVGGDKIEKKISNKKIELELKEKPKQQKQIVYS